MKYATTVTSDQFHLGHEAGELALRVRAGRAVEAGLQPRVRAILHLHQWAFSFG